MKNNQNKLGVMFIVLFIVGMTICALGANLSAHNQGTEMLQRWFTYGGLGGAAFLCFSLAFLPCITISAKMKPQSRQKRSNV